MHHEIDAYVKYAEIGTRLLHAEIIAINFQGLKKTIICKAEKRSVESFSIQRKSSIASYQIDSEREIHVLKKI